MHNHLWQERPHLGTSVLRGPAPSCLLSTQETSTATHRQRHPTSDYNIVTILQLGESPRKEK